MSESSDTDHLPFWPEATRDSRNSPDEYAMEAATQILKLNVSVQLYITLELGLIYQNKSNTTDNLSNSSVHGTNYIGNRLHYAHAEIHPPNYFGNPGWHRTRKPIAD